MTDKFLTTAGKHVDNRNLNHCVASWLLAHRSAGYVNENLSGECRVVDAHVELHALVLCLSAYALANKVYTVSHVANLVD